MGPSRSRNSTRAGNARSVKSSPRPRRKPARIPLPDLHSILDRFGYALAVVTVSRIAIEASEKLAQEECALRQGIAGLDAVYNDHDLAIAGFSGRGGAVRGTS